MQWGLVLLLVPLPGCTTFSKTLTKKYQTVADAQIGDEEAAAALEDKALCQLQKGNVEKAQQLLQESLEADVNYGPAHNLLGKIYYDQHKLYLAAWEYQYAAKLMPGRHEPYNNLGLTFEKADRLDEAIGWYSKAYDLAPQSVDVIANLARAKAKRGDQDDLLVDLLDELTLRDNRPRWLEWAGEQRVKLKSKGIITAPEIGKEPNNNSSVHAN
ncbi:tetratricopeptide repeat protein [bacterium]|nr:tetratricopeptide repeat protein [bacterium]